jgi:hypothetical protein
LKARQGVVAGRRRRRDECGVVAAEAIVVKADGELRGLNDTVDRDVARQGGPERVAARSGDRHADLGVVRDERAARGGDVGGRAGRRLGALVEHQVVLRRR